ncbi:hypothetical protein [Aquabacterium sp.]|uniref:hypothetical protein n=1 Tax=Aquabacterium sp. TaxID=1872578 RepID=UPI002CA0A82C|nr:hypothetical protein [Aquabacterium sp.]HSW04154.1 hypothetical protein [Aquabacterium sp.]
MKNLIRGAALLVAVCCAVWLAVLWRWRATGHDMTAEDFVIYLLLLPLVVFGFVLALRWAWRGAVAQQAAAAASPAAAGASPGAAAPGQAVAAEEAQRHATAQLLCAHLLCACADSPQALLAAGQSGQPLPGLDASLQNAEGLPVMSARIPDLPVDAMRAALTSLQRSVRRAGRDAGAVPLTLDDDAPMEPPAEHLQRALAALQAPLMQALQSLQPWHERFADPTNISLLRVLLACPAWWSEGDSALAEAWLRQLLADEGSSGIAPARFVIDCQALGSVELWAEADRRLHSLNRDKRRDLLLLAACHSDLSDDAIAMLESQRRLFSPGQHPKGLIPSEAAAVLVLAPPDWPAAPDAATPPVQLHRPAVMKRDKSIEAAGSVSSQVLAEVLAAALGAAQLQVAEVAAVVCDADQHTPRGTELFGTTLKVLPHLDPAEHLCMTGGVAGHGEAGALMVVATAAVRALADQKPCLGLALGDSHWRLALLARPPQASTP